MAQPVLRAEVDDSAMAFRVSAADILDVIAVFRGGCAGDESEFDCFARAIGFADWQAFESAEDDAEISRRIEATLLEIIEEKRLSSKSPALFAAAVRRLARQAREERGESESRPALKAER
jgi:hypothetical protein